MSNQNTIQIPEFNDEDLEDLLNRIEDLCGWNNYESGSDPRRQIFKRFLRKTLVALKDLETEQAEVNV